jgi:hypothetical protein
VFAPSLKFALNLDSDSSCHAALCSSEMALRAECGGGRYDGYERSLESAEVNILEGEGDLKRRNSNRSLGSMAAEAWQQGAINQRRRDQLKQGFRTVTPMPTLQGP